MKKSIVFLISVFLFTILNIACSATLSTVSSSDVSKLKSEPMEIWTRPIEMGFSSMGIGEGVAESNQTQDSLVSQKVVESSPSFFIGGSISEKLISPMVKLAAFNAIKNAQADGMYILMAKEEANGSEKKAWVKGVLLKLDIYGPVSVERADSKRMCLSGCKNKSLNLVQMKQEAMPEKITPPSVYENPEKNEE